MSLQRPPRPQQPRQPQVPQLQWNRWNLLLLIPLYLLLTPLYNRVTPKLFGMPFFYWFQLASVVVGVLVTALVYIMTREDDYVVTGGPDRLNVDALDEGAGR
ncbi:MAG TPA: DUF3311 domain-containing protein [Pseudonocardiaceae bacterium]|jgi:hypothetical protein